MFVILLKISENIIVAASIKKFGFITAISTKLQKQIIVSKFWACIIKVLEKKIRLL